MGTQFEAEVGRLMTQFNSPGVAVDMVARGKRHSAYMGRSVAGGALPVTAKSRFATVCLVKLLVTIELLRLAEKGEISLDSPIADHLPELGDGPKAKGRHIKIRHLLSHTGGYRGFPLQKMLPLARESWQNCVKLLHDTDQLFEPGTVFDDDHLGHVILGEVLARLKNKPVLDVVCENVLRPLGIAPNTRTKDVDFPEIYTGRHGWNRTDKKWEVEPDDYADPGVSAGAFSPLSMSSADLARLGEALMTDPPRSGRPAISDWVKDKLFTTEVAVPREISPVRATRWSVRGFGLGMATFRDGHKGHVTTGRGQNSAIIFNKDRSSTAAIAMNTTNVLEREALLNMMFRRFADDLSIVPEAKVLDMDFDEFIRPFSTREIGGVYVGFSPEPIEIFASPKAFVVRIDKEDRYRFEASPENRLVMHAKMHMPLGLFQDPVSRRPCLSVGMHAFKKVN